MPNPEDSWTARMERAVELLARRLDEPPSLEELARAAGVSPFHFHRIWRALTGEPVGQTVARLRIAVSQQRLAVGGSSITAIALDGGFGTPQSFARAFRRVTGLSPSEFLSSGLPEINVGSPPDAEIRIDLREAGELVALRREGGAYRELNALFWQVWNWAESAGKLDGLRGLYGIPWDDPVSVSEDRLRYDACLALADPGTPAPPMRIVPLPAGDYAALRHLGSYDGLEDANQALMRWLIASGRTPADFPLFHHFLDDPEEVPEAALRTDVLIRLDAEDGR